VIQRAIIHVAGPAGSGKTTFVEAILSASDAAILAARCVRDDSLRRPSETRPKAHAELRRYRQAGASGVAVFAFSKGDLGSGAFFTTALMSDYSQAVILEGDNPVGSADLDVFVAAAPRAAEQLFRRRRVAGERAKSAALRELLRSPDGAGALLDATLGLPLSGQLKRYPGILEDARRALLEGIATSRKRSPPELRSAGR